MEFRDLKKQYAVLKDEIDKGILNVIESASFIQGKEVKELEEKLAAYVGVKHCVTCANGTDALQIALMTWGIGEGDVVFVPDFTFFSSGEVVSSVGATPIFVDVERDTFNISPIALRNMITKVISNGGKPRVIIAVDLFGQPANYVELRKIADEYGLLILEDGAQGFGGSINEKKACSFGDISTTSFFPAKPLGCYGDGGAIFTDNDEWASLIRSYCVHGKGSSKYDNIRIGMNSRLDTIQAAVLLAKLDQFINYEMKKMQEIAAWYTKELEGVVQTPIIKQGYESSWAQYSILLKDAIERESLMKYMKNKGIPIAIYYQKPMHKQTAFKFGGNDIDYPVTNMLVDVVLSLPIHPYIEIDEINYIIESIKGALLQE
jgi:dTDP-4-amino-4,6-dideoxygalactose transaminase